jgi:EAL and modified HD-GYP domain-containing signal transduction protein
MFTFITRWLRQRAPAEPAVQLAKAVPEVQGEDEGTENLVVLRRAVLNRDKKVTGYEFFQATEVGSGTNDAQHQRSFLLFLESVIAGAKLGQRHAFTEVSASLVFEPLVQRLARAGVVVLLRFEPEAQDVARVSERMQAMRNAGMLLGLADARIALDQPALGNCASVGFLPVDQIIPPDLLQAVRLLTTRYPQMQLCASGVKSYEEFEVCRRLRLHGFIGSFATHRRDWQDNTVDPGTMRLFKLVNSLRAGAEMDAIIQDIKLDPLLSYRVLCYANSAAIAAQRKILALKDAILLIGREPLFRWLVLLLCASAPSRGEDSALLENALARGRMMELLAEKISPAAPEDFFLTGVLSLLDVILQLPAPALLDALDLPDEVKAALLERKGPYAGLLRLAEASEQDRTDGIRELCSELGIEPALLSGVQSEALIWARGQSQAEDASLLTPPPAAAAVQEAVQRAPTEPPAVTEALFEAAQQGDAKAQWTLAVMHAQGQGGVPQDGEQAVLWYQKAAQQGFAPAQATLGLMYAAGQGVEKDVGKALALLQQAALQGDMEAQYNLAVLHEQGLAAEQNLEQARVWFSRAAEQGLPKAQERLGLMLAIGQAMEQDLVEAHKWFYIASQGKQETAKANLAHSLTLMEPDQVAEAQSRASLWLQNHAAAAASG